MLLGVGGEYRAFLSGALTASSGFVGQLDLGGTWAVGYDGNELLAWGRLGLDRERLVAGAIVAGYRGYFGDGRVKTFVDLDGALHLAPVLAVGPRVGFGTQLELSEVAGLFLGVAAQFGFGRAIRFDAELVLGLQLRSYLLE